MSRKPNTRGRTQRKKKLSKKTRRNAKTKKNNSASYLATINNDEFVMVDKKEANSATKYEDDPKKIVVGKIYANWCGHCQNMSADWNAFIGKLDTSKYIVLETEESELPSRLDEINEIYLKNADKKLTANGFPTIYRIENNVIYYYDGDRTSDAMYDWFVTQKGGQELNKSAQNIKKTLPAEKKGWFSWW